VRCAWWPPKPGAQRPGADPPKQYGRTPVLRRDHRGSAGAYAINAAFPSSLRVRQMRRGVQGLHSTTLEHDPCRPVDEDERKLLSLDGQQIAREPSLAGSACTARPLQTICFDTKPLQAYLSSNLNSTPSPQHRPKAACTIRRVGDQLQSGQTNCRHFLDGHEDDRHLGPAARACAAALASSWNTWWLGQRCPCCFNPLPVDGAPLYGDGRHPHDTRSVPLSPLGSDRVLAISIRHPRKRHPRCASTRPPSRSSRR